MKKIGIFYNPVHIDDKEYLQKRIMFLNKKNIKIFMLNIQKDEHIDKVNYVNRFTNNTIEVLIVFGGDGTMLKAAKLVLEENIPILGFNYGKLGFLSECGKKELDTVIRNLLEHNYLIENRSLLSCNIAGRKNIFALNEIVLTKGKYPRPIKVYVYKDDLLFYKLISDGLIISTPTGSTAYNLSAGGPIVHPECKVIIITPLNPHNLFFKPTVIAADSNIKLIPKTPNITTRIIVDGDVGFTIKMNESVKIKKSEYKSKFIKFPDKKFCNIIRKKFRLNG